MHNSEAPMDGATLKNALHQRGINLRYLGHVVKLIAQSEHKEHLRHIMVRLTLKTKPNSVFMVMLLSYMLLPVFTRERP